MSIIARSHECPACGALMIQRKTWIKECQCCGYLRSELQPGAGAVIGGLEQLRRTNFETILDWLARHVPLDRGRLLEVGSDHGWFLEAAARRGMVVEGLEAHEVSAAATRAKGFRVTAGFFPQDARGLGPYSVIAFNDVFEHVAEPDLAIRTIEDLLAPGGIVLLNQPTAEGVLFRIAQALDNMGWSAPYERLWQKGLPSPHISYFTPSNLVKLAKRHTSLRLLDQTTLPSMSRNGLRERIKSTFSSWKGDLMFVPLWLASFVIDYLPADEAVVLLQKPTVYGPGNAVENDRVVTRSLQPERLSGDRDL